MTLEGINEFIFARLHICTLTHLQSPNRTLTALPSASREISIYPTHL